MRKFILRFRLKEVLEEKERGIRDLARATGLQVSTISAIANNHTRGVYFMVIEKICSELDISHAELFDTKPIKE
jgi:DNA-binding Xre family transcriptional regulator